MDAGITVSDAGITIHVTSVDHVSGKTGKYFNFDRASVPAIAEGESSDKNSALLFLTNTRTGARGTVVVWGYNNGGSDGTAHGRWHSASDAKKAAQWQVGDVLESSRESLPRIDVTSVDHAHGPLGKYFNFDRTSVQAIATGEASKSNSTVLRMTNTRTGASGDVIVWGCSNGGSDGTAHGRWHPPSAAAAGQWQVGDVLVSCLGPVPSVSVWQPRVPVLVSRAYNPLVCIFLTGPACAVDGARICIDAAFSDLYLTADDSSSILDERCRVVALQDVDCGAGCANEGEAPAGAAERILRCSPIVVPEGQHTLWLLGGLHQGVDLDSTLCVKLAALSFDGTEHAVFPSGGPSLGRAVRPGLRLRHRGDDDSLGFRIPGLVRTTAETLLACYDIRRGGMRDLQGDMDIGVSRSVDGGYSWEPMRIAMTMGEWGGLPRCFNGVSDACLLVDTVSGRVFVFACWMHGLRDRLGHFREDLSSDCPDWSHQWHTGPSGSAPGLSPRETAQFLMAYSDDDGCTWSDPVNLTEHLKDPSWYLLAPAPGSGITTSTGALVIPIQGRDAKQHIFSTIAVSQDRGETWSRAPSFARSGTNECAVVELSDGSLMLNMRVSARPQPRLLASLIPQPRARAVSVTYDLGCTWTVHPSDGVLPEPTCMASLLRIDRGDGEDVLLFSNPANTRRRTNLTIKASTDGGLTWPEENWVELDDQLGGCGYSCLAVAGEGAVGIVFESSQGHLVFQRVKYVDLGLA